MDDFEELDFEFKLRSNLDVQLADDNDSSTVRTPDPGDRTHRLTESLLRQDVTAPHVVRFASSPGSRRRTRQVFVVVTVVALSVFAVLWMTKVLAFLTTALAVDRTTGRTVP